MTNQQEKIIYEIRYLGTVQDKKQSKQIEIQSVISKKDCFVKFLLKNPLNGEGGYRVRQEGGEIPPFSETFFVENGKLKTKSDGKK